MYVSAALFQPHFFEDPAIIAQSEVAAEVAEAKERSPVKPQLSDVEVKQQQIQQLYQYYNNLIAQDELGSVIGQPRLGNPHHFSNRAAATTAFALRTDNLLVSDDAATKMHREQRLRS